MVEKESPPEKGFTAPWSSKGWYGDDVRRRQDPEILKIYKQAGKGRVNPIGFTADKPALAVTPGTHNPYWQLLLAATGIPLGAFLYVQLAPNPLGAVAVAGIFWLLTAWIWFVNIRRIPAWHRARRMVRAYLIDKPGKFPKELRWYS